MVVQVVKLFDSMNAQAGAHVSPVDPRPVSANRSVQLRTRLLPTLTRDAAHSSKAPPLKGSGEREGARAKSREPIFGSLYDTIQFGRGTYRCMSIGKSVK